MNYTARHCAAFSLIELLVSLAIIAVLAALSFVSYPLVMEKTRSTACTSNLRQMGAALHAYVADHEQRMPNVIDQNFREILEPYADRGNIFMCPSDPHRKWGDGSSYQWIEGLSGQLFTSLKLGDDEMVLENAHDIPVACDKGSWHRLQVKPSRKNGEEAGFNYLYADGSVGN